MTEPIPAQGIPHRAQDRGPYIAVTAGHAAIDLFNSMGPVLLAFLRTPMALTTAQVGLAVGTYQFLAGVTQPPFGWLADRIGSRWLGPLSFLWTISLVATAFFVANETGNFSLFLAVFALAALGSGAFHPQGTMHAARAVAGRAATTTAVFFFCGQIGLTIGPILTGLLLARVGPAGIYGLALAISPVVLVMAYGLRNTSGQRVREAQQAAASASSEPYSHRVAALLTLVFTLRGWIVIGTASFLPTLFQEAGRDAASYGLLTGLFWLGGAVTGVLAGGFADRWGRRPVVAVTTAVGSVLLILLPVSTGWSTFVVSLATGAALGAAHSILIVMAQSLLSVRQGLASGLALGYFFGIGAVSSIAIGALADLSSLAVVIQWGAALGLCAALATLLLPSSRVPATTPRSKPVLGATGTHPS